MDESTVAVILAIIDARIARTKFASDARLVRGLRDEIERAALESRA